MANVGKCQLHIPHKMNMVEWAEMLGHQLFPDNPVKAAQLALLGRQDGENFKSIERYLNDVAPDCFGGGCGGPGDGENSCVEGLNNTTGSDNSTVSGLNNHIDAFDPQSAIVVGENNQIINGTNVGNNVIIGGDTNTIDDCEECAVGGKQNSIANVQQSFAFGSTLIVRSNACAAFGQSNIADVSADQAFVEGFGAASWAPGQHAHANSQVNDNFLGSGLARSSGQYSRIPYQISLAGGTPNTIGDTQFADLPYAAHVTGDLIARDNTADVVSVWTVDAIVACDGAGGFRIVGTPTTTLVAQDAGAAAWTAAAPAIDGTGLFNLAIAGDAVNQTNFTLTLHLTEILGGI